MIISILFIYEYMGPNKVTKYLLRTHMIGSLDDLTFIDNKIFIPKQLIKSLFRTKIGDRFN